MGLVWLLVFYITLLPIATMNSLPNDGTLDLFQAALYIVREHISRLSYKVAVLEEHIFAHMAPINADLLDYLLPRIGETMSVQLSLGTYQDPMEQFYVFVADSPRAFYHMWSRLENLIFAGFEDRQFYFLIILTQYRSSDDLERILKICSLMNVINVNVITNHPALGTCMYTYEPYSKDACNVIQPAVYYRFKHGSENLTDIFPEKLRNFHGCPLRVAARILEPMIRFVGNMSNPEPMGEWENLLGIEGLLLREMAMALNFSITLLPFDPDESMLAPHTYAEVTLGNADIAIGGFTSFDSQWFFSTTMQYYHSPFVYVIRGWQGLSPLGRLARPFSRNFWTLLSILLICGVIAIQILRFVKPAFQRLVLGEGNSSPVTNLFALVLGYSISPSPRRILARYLLMLWLLVTLIIRSAYQGALYDAIRLDKFVKIPSGYDDLIDWNYKILVSPEIEDFELLRSYRVQTVFVDSDGIKRLQQLEQMEGNYATVTLKDYYMHYMGAMSQNGSDLIILDHVMSMCQIMMIVQKQSILLNIFNKKLQAFIESGIIGYIKSNVNNERFIFRQNPPRKPITNERIQAVYEIYAGMVTLAFLVFCVELASIYSARLRRMIEGIN